MRHRDGRSGHVVVAGEDRAGTALAGQQFFGRQQTRAVGVVARLHQMLVQTQPGLRKRGLKSFETPRAGRQIGVSGDIADAGMPLLDQMLGDLLGRSKFIDAHTGHVGTEMIGRDHYHRHLGAHQFQHRSTGFAQRRRQDHPGHTLGEFARGLAFGIGVQIVPAVDHQLDRSARGDSQHAQQQLAQIRAAGVAVDQRNARALRSGQRTCGEVGCVAEFVDRTHHALAGGIAHAAVIVDHTRNGHRRDLCQRRYLVDGGRAAGAADRFPDLLQAWPLQVRTNVGGCMRVAAGARAAGAGMRMHVMVPGSRQIGVMRATAVAASERTA